MNAGVERRLARLEAGSGNHPLAGLAERLEAARKRYHAMTPEEHEQDRRESVARLAQMRAAHAAKPLQGLALRLLRAKERVHAQDAADVAALTLQPGAAP